MSWYFPWEWDMEQWLIIGAGLGWLVCLWVLDHRKAISERRKK